MIPPTLWAGLGERGWIVSRVSNDLASSAAIAIDGGVDADTEAVHAADTAFADDAFQRGRQHPCDRPGARHLASTAREYLGRVAAAGVTWPLDPDMTDEALMGRLFVNGGVRLGARFHAAPDWAVLARELKRPDVNLMILWEEYRASHPEGYAYSRFCELFRSFERRLSPTMRQQHVAGHKAFVDYSGKRVPIVDPSTGELRMAEIFVAVLGASSLTLCRGDVVADAAGLDRRSCPHVPLLRRGAPPAGAGQSQERRQQGLVLRSRGQP